MICTFSTLVEYFLTFSFMSMAASHQYLMCCLFCVLCTLCLLCNRLVLGMRYAMSDVDAVVFLKFKYYVFSSIHIVISNWSLTTIMSSGECSICSVLSRHRLLSVFYVYMLISSLRGLRLWARLHWHSPLLRQTLYSPILLIVRASTIFIVCVLCGLLFDIKIHPSD